MLYWHNFYVSLLFNLIIYVRCGKKMLAYGDQLMKKIIYSTLLTIALLFSIQITVNAATLGLTTQNPTLGSNSVTFDYLEFSGDGDLSSFGGEINSSNGVTPIGLTDLSFGIGFPIATPTSGATGFFDLFDDNGQFLGGDLFAVGFTEDVIELQFNNLVGSSAGNFGSSVLALITFDDPLGTNPFNSLIDGNFYSASVSISNVVSVSEPTVISIFVLALFLMGIVLLKRRNTIRTI